MGERGLTTISKIKVPEDSRRVCGRKVGDSICNKPASTMWLVSDAVASVRAIDYSNIEKFVALCEEHSLEFEAEIAEIAEETYDFSGGEMKRRE